MATEGCSVCVKGVWRSGKAEHMCVTARSHLARDKQWGGGAEFGRCTLKNRSIPGRDVKRQSFIFGNLTDGLIYELCSLL